MDLFQVLIIVFATSSGLVCIYSLVSSYLLYTSMTKLSKGEEFGKLVRSLFITVLVGFFYALWTLLIQLGLVKPEGVTVFISNLVISLFFVTLAYLAFLTRSLSMKFGFRKVGNEITSYLKKPGRKAKKVR